MNGGKRVGPHPEFVAWLDFFPASSRTDIPAAINCGVALDRPAAPRCLLTVAELYPEIVSGKGKEDDQPSCSAAEALTRKEPFINQNLACQALGMLTQLLRRGALAYQGGFCNLSTGQLVSLPIKSGLQVAKRSCVNGNT